MQRQDMMTLLGPAPERCPLEPEVLESVECTGYRRDRIRFRVEPDDVSYAYVLIPTPPQSAKRAAVYCHHQHTPERIGKTEVVGLEGNPDLRYAAELAARGYVTFAPDAFTFGERRNIEDPTGYAWYELAIRLVHGRTMLAKIMHDVFAGLDLLAGRPEVDPTRIGFIGHSYGGRMAIFSAALDDRIKAAVCNCGCISYRHSCTPDTGVQIEFVVPGVMAAFDIDALVGMIAPRHLLISAAEEDVWCRGVRDVYDKVKPNFSGGDLELAMYPGGHSFTSKMRERAYAFLDRHLSS